MNATRLQLASLSAAMMLSGTVQAQDHDHHSLPPPTPSEHDHSQHQPVDSTGKEAPQPKPKVIPPAVDHSEMGHAPPAPQAAEKPVDHAAMGHAPPESEEPVDHAAMGHAPADQKAAGEVSIDHASMGHEQTEPDAQEAVDHAAMGHGAPAAQSSHEHSAMGHGTPRPADQPITPIPVLTDADRAAATPPPAGHPAHDNTMQSLVVFNRLEAFDADEGTGIEWEGQAWFGTDRNKLWLRTEGERTGHGTETADLEVLYGRALAPWWDVVAGVRHDFKPGHSQNFLAIGVVGLAPYKFEVEATAYLGESGQTAARVEAEYETLLTNRLILQPLVEVNFHGQDDEERGIGSGLSTAEAGLRLRYEISRRFAPYVGVVREWSFGNTADFRREEGEATNDTRFVAGLRIWF